MPKLYQQRVRERVEAMEITPESIGRAVIWAKGHEVEETAHDGRKMVGINVPTMSRIVRVSEGDYLVLLRGTFVQMTAYEFEQEYELVTP